jgi:hypothetical protein
VRPAPGGTEPAASEPGAGRRGTGYANCAESSNLPVQVTDRMFLSLFTCLLLRVDRMKALRTHRLDAAWCHIAVDLAA